MNTSLNLQLFATKVNNPYTIDLNKNYTLSYNDEKEDIKLVDLSHYAEHNIPNYDTITTIPDDNIKYLNSGLIAANYIDNMFYMCSNLTTIGDIFSKNNPTAIDTSYITSMGGMFIFSSSLTTLDLSGIDTSNVTSMSSMFDYCSSLTTLDLSSFDTSNVINMAAMFNHCENLTTLDISNFNTSNVINMDSMFYKCYNLTTIKGVIDMKSCTDYSNMFQGCSNLRGVKIKNPPSGFDGAKLTSSQYTIVF